MQLSIAADIVRNLGDEAELASSAGKAPLAAAACTDYYLVAKGSCAQACWGATVGQCPVAFLEKYAHFASGMCAAVGYATEKGNQTTPAGPCGDITVTQYTK